jgi:hypothetical protein
VRSRSIRDATTAQRMLLVSVSLPSTCALTMRVCVPGCGLAAFPARDLRLGGTSIADRMALLRP